MITFVFDEDQDQLRETVREFLTDKSPESQVRRLMETAEGYDPKVWTQLCAELGLAGLAVPERFGGSGFGFAEVGVVLEEAGAALLCAPYLSSVVLGATTLVRSADVDAAQAYLPALCAGDLRVALATTEPAGSWDATISATVAELDGRDGIVTGVKDFVIDGASADLLLVSARTPDGLGLFAVAADAPGVVRSSRATLDQTRKLARIELAGARGRRIGTGDAAALLADVYDRARIALAAEQVGGAARTVQLAVGYAKERFQFGRPIGSFQAIKHKCADLQMALESARAAAHFGLFAVDADEDVALAARVAKSYCSEAFMTCAAENIQIHGGIGVTWEHPSHLYFKRAKSSQLMFGSPGAQRAELARLLDLAV